MGTAKKKAPKFTLPKGDKVTSQGIKIVCERHHEWYVVSSSLGDIDFINIGCHEFITWEAAFEHFQIEEWYSTSDYAQDTAVSEEKREEVRKRCIQRLKFLKQEFECNG